MHLTLEGSLRLYDSLGLAVVPVNHDRVPLVKWKEDYVDKNVRPSWGELENWFVKPQVTPNMSIICGKLSGGFVGLDFEEEKPYFDFFTPEGAKKLESTTIVENTAHGGVHVWLKALGEAPKRNVRICESPALDLLGEGGLMTVTPSTVNHMLCKPDKTHCPHTGTTAYDIRGTSFEIDIRDNILDSVVKRANQLGWKLKTDQPTDFRAIITSGVSSGMRNQRLFDLARRLIFDFGLDMEFAWLELQNVNNRSKPPLAERELKTLFESAKKYPTKPVLGRVLDLDG